MNKIFDLSLILKKTIGSGFLRKKPFLNDKVIFLHIPKCGGTSMINAISRYYHVSDVGRIGTVASKNTAKIAYQIVNELVDDYYYVLKTRETVLLYLMFTNKKFISGHYCFNEAIYRKFNNKYKFITILRDPVKRVLSHYFYNRYKIDNHLKIKDNIEDFIETERCQNLGHEYVKFLGGISNKEDYCSKESIARAKNNLHKFYLVGCLEFLDDFAIKFENSFGAKLEIPQKNISPLNRSERKLLISKDIENKINRICKPDSEIYQYALDNFINRNAKSS